jgi:hypothetical protein
VDLAFGRGIGEDLLGGLQLLAQVVVGLCVVVLRGDWRCRHSEGSSEAALKEGAALHGIRILPKEMSRKSREWTQIYGNTKSLR